MSEEVTAVIVNMIMIHLHGLMITITALYMCTWMHICGFAHVYFRGDDNDPVCGVSRPLSSLKRVFLFLAER